MLGTVMLAGLGCAALMRNPRKRRKSRRRNPRKGAKTYMARILQAYYPDSGWSDVLEEETSKEMRAQLLTYRKNDPGTSYRVIHRRVPIEQQSNPGGRKRKITKKQWYALGAWSNSALYRVQKGGRWHYYQTNPRRRSKRRNRR